MNHQLVIPPFQSPWSGRIDPADLRSAGIGEIPEVSPAMRLAGAVIGVTVTSALAYHGYHRNKKSVGWAVAWGLGAVIWPIMIPVAVVQGYAKPRKGR